MLISMWLFVVVLDIEIPHSIDDVPSSSPKLMLVVLIPVLALVLVLLPMRIQMPMLMSTLVLMMMLLPIPMPIRMLMLVLVLIPMPLMLALVIVWLLLLIRIAGICVFVEDVVNAGQRVVAHVACAAFALVAGSFGGCQRAPRMQKHFFFLLRSSLLLPHPCPSLLLWMLVLLQSTALPTLDGNSSAPAPLCWPAALVHAKHLHCKSQTALGCPGGCGAERYPWYSGALEHAADVVADVRVFVVVDARSLSTVDHTYRKTLPWFAR